jgi:alpha-glucoside transport system substrate-binding protein
MFKEYRMSKKSFVLLLVLTLMLSFAVTVPVVAQDDLMFPIGEGPFHWEDLAAFEEIDLSGQTVEIAGPWLTIDEELFTSVFS